VEVGVGVGGQVGEQGALDVGGEGQVALFVAEGHGDLDEVGEGVCGGLGLGEVKGPAR